MILFGGPTFIGTRVAGRAAASHGAAVSVDPEELARKHVEKGFRSAYSPLIPLEDTDRIKAFRQAFEKAKVTIGEVGYWDNLLDTDADSRKHNREQMVRSLALAEEIGARCAINMFGSYCHGSGINAHNALNFSDHDGFDVAVELARSFIDQVKPKNAYFVYEIFPFNVVDSPEAIARLVKAVDRKQFGVHMDLVNLINTPRKYFDIPGILNESLRLFGDRIVSSHAKDLRMYEPAVSVILNEVRPGLGNVDYSAYLKGLASLKRDVPLLMEHLSDEYEYDAAAAYIRAAAKQAGVNL